MDTDSAACDRCDNSQRGWCRYCEQYGCHRCDVPNADAQAYSGDVCVHCGYYYR